MPKIGLLAGRDRAFTDALIDRVQSTSSGGVGAEYITVGGVRMAEAPGYEVIVDRISHEVPFYQSYLKNAALMGSHVVNDPFWQLAEDKFVDTAAAAALGIRVPRTVILPNCEHIDGVVPESLRNRAEPLDWEGAMAEIGFPMVMRSHWGAASRRAYIVQSPEELTARWERSGIGQFMLQEWIAGASYVHCLVVGDDALPVPRPLRHAPGATDDTTRFAPLQAEMADSAVRLSRALGYHMNVVEFAVRDGMAWTTDWLNFCPPIDPTLLSAAEFEWAIARAAALVLRLADTPKAPTYRWDPLLAEA